jgi:exonuclease 1
LRAEQVSYVVAPYEADAQMRYLESEGIVDGIITEDSDLLVFGARCVLFKFDTAGHVVVIRREDFGLLHTKTASFIGWNDNHFREMAIMSGCDYLDSIQGIGVITAAKLMRKYKSVEKVLQSIRMEGNKKIPKDYLAAFRMAELAFKHQRVYDPRTQRLAYLTEPSDGTLDEKQEAYVGRLDSLNRCVA